MRLDEFLKEVGGKKGDIEKTLTGKEALGAVKQNGFALRYVNPNIFEVEVLELTIDEIAEKYGVDVDKIKIKK